MAAEHAGVDLVFPCLPPEHIDAAKTYSLNFLLSSFKKPHLSKDDVKEYVQMAKTMDAIAIGPGLGNHPETIEAIKLFFKQVSTPMVIDASALMELKEFPHNAVLTPHRGEFKRLTGEDPTEESVQKWAKYFGCTIVCKGPRDIIADSQNIAINETGNALMTVGGTGDALAGFIAGLIARGYSPFLAGEVATNVLGLSGDYLATMQSSLTAREVIQIIPTVWKKQVEIET
ncbi:NAD(P)H-hydrate dehydratase [Candidatus Peregrinibacteria bacterium]|nr:MAG: NAD(P)H-hydrate dehydratase [Candidatus Peregrinibacteria bacterium]